MYRLPVIYGYFNIRRLFLQTASISSKPAVSYSLILTNIKIIHVTDITIRVLNTDLTLASHCINTTVVFLYYDISEERRMLADKVISLKDRVTNAGVLKRAIYWKMREFKPKVRLFIDSRKYIIKTVDNIIELEKALELRYEVFYRETLNKDTLTGIDIDKFDLLSDHLIIIDKNINKVVGTYRLISSEFSDSFYSETEFSIDSVKEAAGIKIELGRACVHRDYRNGTAIALLWKGLSEYIKTLEAKYLFGCSSVSTTNIVEICLIYKYIKELHLSPESMRVYPKGKFKLKEIGYHLDAFHKFDIKSESIRQFIPALLKSYLKAGSVICGEPALDKKFKCADFFTVLDLQILTDTYEKRYKVVNG